MQNLKDEGFPVKNPSVTTWKPTITIEGKEYDVKPLTPAQGQDYRRFLDELAVKILNPWQELWEKIMDLPPNLQELAFAKLPASILPLIGHNYRRVVIEPAAVARLFWLATGEAEVVKVKNAKRLYYRLIEIVGPSLLVEVETPESDEPVGPSPQMDAMIAPLLAEAEKRKATDDTDKTETDEEINGPDGLGFDSEDPPPLPEATDDTDMTEEEAIGHPAEI